MARPSARPPKKVASRIRIMTVHGVLVVSLTVPDAEVISPWNSYRPNGKSHTIAMTIALTPLSIVENEMRRLWGSGTSWVRASPATSSTAPTTKSRPGSWSVWCSA